MPSSILNPREEKARSYAGFLLWPRWFVACHAGYENLWVSLYIHFERSAVCKYTAPNGQIASPARRRYHATRAAHTIIHYRRLTTTSCVTISSSPRLNSSRISASPSRILAMSPPRCSIDFLPNHNLHDNPTKSQICRAVVCCPHTDPPPQGEGTHWLQK